MALEAPSPDASVGVPTKASAFESTHPDEKAVHGRPFLCKACNQPLQYVPYLHPVQPINAKIYTGQTAGLTNRLSEHNSGETKSIAKGIPWVLVWSVQCDNRSQAMQWEKKIKSRGAKRFLLDRGIGMQRGPVIGVALEAPSPDASVGVPTKASAFESTHPDEKAVHGRPFLCKACNQPLQYVPYLHPVQPINAKFYTGQTAELTNRLSEHNSGETKSIAKGIPWVLVWSVQCDNRSQAMQWEKKIKSRDAKRFLLDRGIGM